MPERPARAAVPAAPGNVATAPWRRASRLSGIAAAPSVCSAFLRRRPSPGHPLEEIAREPDVGARDASLVALEGKGDTAEIRALRADLAPIACADLLVDPILAGQPSVSGRVGHLLLGLSVGAKLARTGEGLPKFQGRPDKTRVKEFIAGPFAHWIAEQAAIVQQLSGVASQLAGYGRGIAAIEAGDADLRLVDRIRAAPAPQGWDAELQHFYRTALDEALEPRKRRGRDAVLTGLADFATAGILRDARVDHARTLLGKMYGGRRIDALDELLVPTWSLEASAPRSSISTFWDDVLPITTSDAEAVSRLPWGIPASFRGAQASGSDYARARFEMGRRYFRRDDFIDAAYALSESSAPADRLILAISLALAQGPRHAFEMMNAPSPAALSLQHTEALDALTREKGPFAGMAAFDAAHLRSLSPPDGAEATAYFRDVAERFTRAAELLSDPSHQRLAAKRAEEARAIAAKAGE